MDFPGGSDGKVSAYNVGDPGCKIFLIASKSGFVAQMEVLEKLKSQGWGSLVGCRLWGRTESDTTEAT